jgi:hypothetical protein
MTTFAHRFISPTDTRPYQVAIVAGPRTGEWGRYSTADVAFRIAAALRKSGLDARVLDRNNDVLSEGDAKR